MRRSGSTGSLPNTPSIENVMTQALILDEEDPQPSTQWLPKTVQRWPLPARKKEAATYADPEDVSLEEVRSYARGKPWLWPSRRTYFFCDIHADTDAFLLSLQASRGVKRTGPGDSDFELTPEGQSARFVIGGDCFDKGPANLRLLRCLHALIQRGAEVTILAGNHDLRTHLGLAYAGRRETKFQHLFVRMGKKTIPLFHEIHQEMRERGELPGDVASDDQVRRELFPSEQWYSQFASEVEGLMPEPRVRKELNRIREKSEELQRMCSALGLRLGDVHAALAKARQMFLEPSGEFAWYFERMTLAHRDGSFLFVHAGVDDTIARVLRASGIEGVNEQYFRLKRENLFDLYNGAVGNAFRTKYRDIDFPLTPSGLEDLRASGIYAVVHGHRNILRGQRITLRAGILNFECDASVDRNTRKIERLSGPGGAVMVFHPHGQLFATSTDYPFVRRFDPSKVFELTTLQKAKEEKA